MSYINKYRAFSQRKPWAARIFLIFLVIIIILSLIRTSLPFAIKFGAISWLESQNVEANIGDIDISLLDGTFAINDMSGKNKAGKGFSLGRFLVAWQWKPFFDHQAVIDQIEVRSLNIDAMLLDNGDMNIAGLVIKAASDETQAKTTGQSAAAPWDASVKNIIFSDIELCLQQFVETDRLILDYCGKLADFNWTGDVSFKPSTQLETTDTPLYVQGTLNINNIALRNNQLELNLLRIGSVDIKNINVDTPDNMSIGNIGVENFSALQRVTQTSSEDAQVFSFDRLDIQPLKFSQLNNLSLGKIELIGSSAYLLVNKDGHMEIESWVPEKQKGVPAKQTDIPETSSVPFRFSFDEFIFFTKKHIVFIDDSLKEPFTSEVHDIDFKLTQLDNNVPDRSSHISLALAIDKHGSFKLNADINPLSDKPSIKGTGEISGFDLRMLAPLTKQYIGHNIRSGQLDIDLKLDVDKGAIDSNMGLALHQFELKTLSKKEAEELNSEFGFPLSSSLSLLRDRDNTIHLNIPVTGDIDNPEFDPRDAIVKASSKAITAAIIHYYTPFGLVFATESLFDLATALNFDPVLFDAGETELTPSHEEQLDKFAALMNERPGIHLTLCGISNNADKNKLFPGLVKAVTPTQEQPAVTKPVPKENLAILKQLAESRSSSIKNYMIHKKSIAPSRLIECSPEYMQDKISGVEISI